TLPERPMAMRNYFYKIITNPYGAVFDHRMEHAVGWFGFEWESSARVKCQLTDREWSLEMAIPFKSFALEKAPADGTRWFAQLVSAGDPGSYYYAWQPVAWTEWDLMPEIIFDSRTPAVQITSMGRPMDGLLDLPVKLKGKRGLPEITVSVKVLDQKDREIYFREEKVAFTDETVKTLRFHQPNLALTGEGEIRWEYQNLKGNTISVQVTSADGKKIFQAEYPFAKTPPNIKEKLYDFIAASRKEAGQPVMHTCYYHTAQKIEASVEVDILRISPEIRQAPRFRLRLIRTGDVRTLLSAEGYILPDGQGKILEAVPFLPDGDYQAVVEILAKDGRVLASQADPFTIRSYPWENTSAGKEEIVVKPFTPLVVSEKSVLAWGRKYTFGDTGLLTSVVSQGAELLAAPVSLKALINGREEIIQPVDWPS
ncbi:MAG TPA: hypothetical protein PKX93_02220, partial [bacterium]|nr:hypothetical protein [bacterium]